MGINDGDKVIEAWLASIAPGAFFYRLPRGFSSNLIFRDMSSLMVMAFSSLSVKSGFDFVQRLVDPVLRFTQLPNEHSYEGKEIDFEDGCAHFEGSKTPTLEDIEAWRSDLEHDRFDGCAHSSATLLMVRDSSKFMPSNRDMVHEARYGGESTNVRDQPFSEEEMRTRTMHICTHRPLPGVTNDMTVMSDASVYRTRANRTTRLRQAYQNYGPWAMSKAIENMTKDYLAGASPTKRSRPTIERTVVIDAVMVDFPEDYENVELHDLPVDWADKSKNYECHVHSLGDPSQQELVTKIPIPNIGEADRKVIYYIETYSKPGDNVLICSNDSDILFILLSNMHRYRTGDKERPWSRTIFLDMNTPNMKKERYLRRFVCLNILADELDTYANQYWKGLENPAQVITVVALLCGSDYTKNPRGIGATKILEAFKIGGWRDLTTLVRLGNVDIVNHHLEQKSDTESWQSMVGDLELVLLDMDALDLFMRRLYQTRLTQKTIKQNSINTSITQNWSRLENFLNLQDQEKKQAAELKLPSELERNGEMRRVMWVIHTWMNSHFNLGDFPAPDLDDPKTGKSVWGWSRARPGSILDHNGEKYLNRDRITMTLKQMLDTEIRLVANRNNPKNPYASSDKDRRWLCCKNNDIVNFHEIWNLIVAEFVIRVKDNVVRFRTPLWQ